MGCQDLRQKGLISKDIQCCTVCHNCPERMQEVEVKGASKHEVCCGVLAKLVLAKEARLCGDFKALEVLLRRPV